VQGLLVSAIALLAVPADGVRYAPHTVVNQAVEAARQQRRLQRQAGFVNACLRRLLREHADLMTEVADDPQARHHHPRWWVDRVRRDHPQDWAAVLQASQEPGPMTLRVNRRRIDRSSYTARLADAGLAALPVGDDGLVLAHPCAVESLPGWHEGWVSVQDAAAQMAAALLLEGRAWGPDDRVLDACAAPGGKTAHLLECADLDLLALDADHTAAWWDGHAFDAILLDAPCTASGIVRRHPDVRWLRRESDVLALAAQQRRLLDALWPLLKPGGRLLYATCSVFRAEGEEQVQAFLARHTDARRHPSAGHLLPGAGRPSGEFNDNPPGGHDGFFYARLDKPAA
jgi:16S rRNA (cytosine967-C5)-methyltransferase